MHFADGAGPYILAEATRKLRGLALLPHLPGPFRLAGGLCQVPRFPHRMGKRLLAIDMLAALDGLHRRKGVVVIRSSDDDSVDLLHLVEHLAVVGELLSLGILLEYVAGMVPVHIAQGDNILALQLAEIMGALSSDSDTGQVELLVRRGRSAQTEHRARNHHEGSRGKCRAAQELAAAEFSVGGAGFRIHELRLQEPTRKGQKFNTVVSGKKEAEGRRTGLLAVIRTSDSSQLRRSWARTSPAARPAAQACHRVCAAAPGPGSDRKSTRLNSSHLGISY